MSPDQQVQGSVVAAGQRVIFDDPRTGWHGVSAGPHVNLDGDVLHDLIDVEFDHHPGFMYLCRRDLLKAEET